MFRPNSETFRGIFGLPGQNQMKAYKKLTVVMFCQTVARKSVAPFSGDFGNNRRRGRPVGQIRNKNKKKIQKNNTQLKISL